jgi:hypothetical protein
VVVRTLAQEKRRDVAIGLLLYSLALAGATCQGAFENMCPLLLKVFK